MKTLHQTSLIRHGGAPSAQWHRVGLRPCRVTCLAAALALTGLTVASPEAHAATGFWYGTSGTLWSTATNWNSVSSGTGSYTLVNGDSIRFFGSSTNKTNNNDITGLSVAGISFQSTSGAYTLNGNKLTLTGGFTFVSAPSSLTVNMPLELNANMSIDSGTNTTLNGVISEIGGSRSFTLSVGRVTLTGSNTFSGGITLGVNAGTSAFVVNNLANIGVAQPLGTGTNLQLGWTSGVGELIYTGSSNVSTDKKVIVGRDGNPTGAIIRNNGSGVMTWNGPLQGTSGAKTFTLGGSNTGTNTWASAIVNAASGTNSFIKADAGTWRLSGANTYSGSTSITGGRLEITSAGTINSTSGVTINGGEFKYNSATALNKAITFTSGTISGTGSIGVAVTAATNNVLSPGNSPGTQAYSAGLTLSPGGTYVWETNSGTGTQGVNWDVINVTAGGLNLSGLSAGGQFTLDLTTLTASGSSGPMDNYTAGGSYTWRIFDANALTLPGSFGSAPYTAGTDITSLFNLVTTNWTGTAPSSNDMSVKVAANGTGIDLVVVPEPATIVLAGLGLGIAGLMIRHRRRSL